MIFLGVEWRKDIFSVETAATSERSTWAFDGGEAYVPSSDMISYVTCCYGAAQQGTTGFHDLVGWLNWLASKSRP